MVLLHASYCLPESRVFLKSLSRDLLFVQKPSQKCPSKNQVKNVRPKTKSKISVQKPSQQYPAKNQVKNIRPKTKSKMPFQKLIKLY